VDCVNNNTLVLGLGNVIMGDEGVGVHVVRALTQRSRPPGVECLDGGTGGFILLEPLQLADRIILIDATDDGQPALIWPAPARPDFPWPSRCPPGPPSKVAHPASRRHTDPPSWLPSCMNTTYSPSRRKRTPCSS